MPNYKKNANNYTTSEGAAKLNISQTRFTKCAKELGFQYTRGRVLEFTDIDLDNIYKYHIKLKLAKYSEYVTVDKYGNRRFYVNVYNEALNARFGITRYLYRYLVATKQWELGVTRIPRGYVLHHIDLNPENDDISNLKLLSVAEHTKLHCNLEAAKIKRAAESKNRKAYTHSEEARQKISKALKGRESPNKGKPISKEHRRKMKEGYAKWLESKKEETT